MIRTYRGGLTILLFVSHHGLAVPTVACALRDHASAEITAYEQRVIHSKNDSSILLNDGESHISIRYDAPSMIVTEKVRNLESSLALDALSDDEGRPVTLYIGNTAHGKNVICEVTDSVSVVTGNFNNNNLACGFRDDVDQTVIHWESTPVSAGGLASVTLSDGETRVFAHLQNGELTASSDLPGEPVVVTARSADNRWQSIRTYTLTTTRGKSVICELNRRGTYGSGNSFQ